MNRTHRTLTLLATLGLASAAHADTTLSFVHFGGELHDAYLKPIIAGFEKKNPGIKITSIPVVGGGYEALTQKALLLSASGNAPDLAQVGYSFTRTLVERAGAQPLEKFMTADKGFKRDNMFGAFLNLGSVNGKLYSVPLATSTPVLYVNAEAFKKAGLNPNLPPRSWQDVRRAAEKLKAAGYEGVVWDWTITGNWVFQAMVENAGGSLADAKDTPKFQEKGGLNAATYLAGLSKDKLMPVIANPGAALNLFTSGKLGMLVYTTASRVNVEKASKFDVRLSTMPTPSGSNVRLPAGGNGVVMLAKDSAKQAAAWKFLRYLTETEAGRVVAENTGYTPGNRAVVEALKSEKASDRNYQVVIRQAPRVTPWQAWPGESSTKISKMLFDMQQSFLSGRETPEKALEGTARMVQDVVRR